MEKNEDLQKGTHATRKTYQVTIKFYVIDKKNGKIPSQIFGICFPHGLCSSREKESSCSHRVAGSLN